MTFNIWLKFSVIWLIFLWSFNKNTYPASENHSLIFIFLLYFFYIFSVGETVWISCSFSSVCISYVHSAQPNIPHLKLNLIHFILLTIKQHPWFWLYYHINSLGCHRSNCTLSPTHILAHFTYSSTPTRK